MHRISSNKIPFFCVNCNRFLRIALFFQQEYDDCIIFRGRCSLRGKQELNGMENIQPGRYRHFKGGEYEVLGMATHSETMEPMVVYRALYGERGLWVRPASMWNETVERDGQVFHRFTYIGDDA